MRITQFTSAATRALLSNKLRSFLTMLGVVIGIAAIVIIVSVGDGAQSLVINQVSSLGGSDLIAVIPGAADDEGPPAAALGITVTSLKNEDVDAIRDIPGIQSASGYSIGQGTISWGNESVDARFTGASADFFDVEDVDFVMGHAYTAEDDQSLRKVAVLGWEVYSDLFGASDPIGQRIRVKKQSFRVVGVLDERGTQFFQNQDNQIFLPLETTQKLLLGVDHLGYARARIVPGESIDQLTEEVRLVLRDQHDISRAENDDFSVRNTAQAISILGSITDVLRYFLAAISALSLIVGGIGIMNIMLVSVLERTKEIGLRKAVGARPFDLRIQFLSETMIISLIGGIIGLIIGIIFSYFVAVIANYLGYYWDFHIGTASFILAIVFPIITGLIFGFYPAAKAARLKPIEALHYE